MNENQNMSYEDLLALYREVRCDHEALLTERISLKEELEEAKNELKKKQDEIDNMDGYMAELDVDCAELRGANEVWERVFNLLYPNNIGERNPNTGA